MQDDLARKCLDVLCQRLGPVSVFKNVTAPQPTTRLLTADDFVHDVRSSKDGPLFAPALFSGSRGNKNFTSASGLCLDFDHGDVDPAEITAAFPNVMMAVYSTHRHTATAPRFRVVMPLCRVVQAGEQDLAGKGLLHSLPERLQSFADVSAVERARAHYLPSCPPGQDPVMLIQDGDPLDVDQLMQIGIHSIASEKKATPPSSRVGDDFNQRNQIEDVLSRCGWQQLSSGYWAKPGSDGTEKHAAVYGGRVFVFSTNAVVPSRAYDSFGLFAFSEHGGDFSAATRDAAARGYGEPQRMTDPAHKVSELLRLHTSDHGAFVDYAALARDVEKLGRFGDPAAQNLFLRGDALIADGPPINWAIDGFIEADSTGQLFGPSGGGKSFVALDLSLSIATGTRWNDRDTAQGAVLYLAGEGRTGLRRRVRAWHLSNPGCDLSSFHMTQRTAVIDSAAVTEIIQAGKQIEADSGNTVGFIVVDTLARHLLGDENSTREMSEFISALETIRSAFPGCTLLIIHHTGNSTENKTRSRGSSALKAAMDFEFCCDKGVLTCTKMKDGDEPEPIEFKLVPVEIATDENGQPVTSCTVQYGERSQVNRAPQLTHQERQALDALLTVCANDPRQVNGQYVADQKAWRQEFYRLRSIEDNEVKTSALKVAFQRVTGSTGGGGLSGKGIIAFTENGVVPLRLADQDTIFNRSISKRNTEHKRNIDGTCSADSSLQTEHNGTSPYKGVFHVPLSCSDDIPVIEVDL
ncbi:MAG: AAA family ATPase [Geobacter sp.]|nr:AAA family ATPase [Geobacter sp.]